MLKNDQSYQIIIGNDSLNQIEKFTDKICEQLFINETYYGNILMALTEMVNLIGIFQEKREVEILYNTDHQILSLSFQPLNIEFINEFYHPISLEDIGESDTKKSLFLLKRLVDQIEPHEQQVVLLFDIGALHNEIYDNRKEKLQSYFSKGARQKVKDKNDYI